MTRLVANNFSTTLNGSITDVATTMTLTSVTGFPAVGSGDTCQVTIDDGTNIEIVTATAISGSDVTITRAQEGTSGTAFADLTTVEIRMTAVGVTDVLGADTTPYLIGPLDCSDSAAYLSFGGSSSTTAYNLTHSGGVPVLKGAANFNYTFTSSALYMQAGTSFNSITFTNDSTRLVIKTNNSERMQVDDSGVNISNGNLVMNSNDITSVDAIEATSLSFDTGTNTITSFEVGTFTPTLFESGSEVVDATYNASFTTGSYIKINSKVWFSMSFRLTAKGTVTGTNRVQIGDLPFTSNSSVGLGRGAITFYVHNGVNATNTGTLMSLMSSSTNYLDIKILDPASDTSENITFDDISTSFYCQFTGYFAT